MFTKIKEFVETELNLGVLSPSLWKSKMLTPHDIAASLETVDIEKLRRCGIEALVIDYDGVIVPYHSINFPPAQKIAKLRDLAEAFEVAILSNRKGKLFDILRAALPQYPIISSEKMKPDPEPYHCALTYLNKRPEEVALIEDRLITGVAGGNKIGMHTVWITPPEKDKEEPFNVR